MTMQGGNSKTDQEVEKIVAQAFERARAIPLASPPYLETRVLATLRERQRKPAGLLFWKAAALSCGALALAVIAKDLLRGSQMSSSSLYTAQVNEAIVVSVEVQPLEKARIAFAEIDLPAGVTFYSKSHPELNGQRNLVLNWAPDGQGSSRFPFAIEASESGIKTVRVRFRDSQRNLLLDRSYEIRFGNDTRGSS